MYLRTIWRDHVVQFPNRFTETPNGDGTTEHVATPGNTLQLGTNQDAVHFNNLEEAVVYYTAAFEMNYAITQALLRKLAELASTSFEGLAPMATAPGSGLRNVVAIDNGETGYANKALFDATAPTAEAVGDAAAVGTAMAAARRDHKHAMPSASDVKTAIGAASTSATGLAPQATAPAAGLRSVLAIDNAETAYTNKALFDATSPSTQAIGDAAAAGSAMASARRDHKHAMPSLANVLAALLTVDGAASGLDADLLDGKHASVFEIAALEDASAFGLYYAMSQATIRDLDTRLAIAEAELATIP